MPLTTEQQQEIRAFLASEIVKKRIPELQDHSVFGDLSLIDQLALWMAGPNKTVHIPLGVLKEFLSTGGVGTLEPVLTGDTITHEVTAEEAGGNKIYEPSLAGKSFFLRLEGRPFKPNEFSILASGGAQITIPGTVLIEGQRFDMKVYELVATGGNTNTTGSFIGGVINVPANKLLTVTDVNKIIQLRGGATQVTLTLPDVGGVADNSFFAIEASITNQRENVIKTTGGQYIYMNGEGYTTLGIRQGETVLVYATGDGWYVWNNFGETYRKVGKIEATYVDDLTENEIPADGRELLRIENPRLWLKVSSKMATVNETAWQTDKTKFSSGNGVTTFRVPDLRDMFLRGATAVRAPGTYQPDQFKSHIHQQHASQDGGGALGYMTDNNNSNTTPATPVSTGATGGDETRPKNVGVIWVIKA